MNILITGGTGYIGSHTAISLAMAGHAVTLLDNLSNSPLYIVNHVSKILNDSVNFVHGDIRDSAFLAEVFQLNNIEAVVHFAGKKSHGESVVNPLTYYENNVCGSVNLLNTMVASNVKTIVFSSSAAVYGETQLDSSENLSALNPSSPYGQTKLDIEVMLKFLVDSDPEWRVCCLRYFNPVGAHTSGLIGDGVAGHPNNLMPHILKVATGEEDHLKIFGDDYATRDGTGERDYIHVEDLSEGHLAALRFICSEKGWFVFNLGTGQTTTVLEFIREFESATGKKIRYKMYARRPGDIAKSYANPHLAKEILGWQAKKTLKDMCSSAHKFKLNSIKFLDE